MEFVVRESPANCTVRMLASPHCAADHFLTWMGMPVQWKP